MIISALVSLAAAAYLIRFYLLCIAEQNHNDNSNAVRSKGVGKRKTRGECQWLHLKRPYSICAKIHTLGLKKTARFVLTPVCG